MTEEEKAVFAILKSNSPTELNDLKVQSGLSNKKWDKTIKVLTKHGIAKVSKTNDGLFVEVVYDAEQNVITEVRSFKYGHSLDKYSAKF